MADDPPTARGEPAMPIQTPYESPQADRAEKADRTDESPTATINTPQTDLPPLLPDTQPPATLISHPLSEPGTWRLPDGTEDVSRFSWTLTKLTDNYGIKKRFSLSLTSEFRSLFVLNRCSKDEILNCEGIGPKGYKRIANATTPDGAKIFDTDTLPPIFSPNGWSPTATYPSNSQRSRTDHQIPQLTFHHLYSNTTVCLSKISKQTYVPTLSPTNAPNTSGIFFDDLTGFTPIEAFKLIDILLGLIPDSGYKFGHSYPNVAEALSSSFDLTRPTPKMHSETIGDNKILITSNAE